MCFTDVCHFRSEEENTTANGSSSPPREIEMKEMGGAKSAGASKDTPDVEIKPCPSKKKPRLFWAMTKTFWFKCLVAALFKVVFDLLQFVSPLILK